MPLVLLSDLCSGGLWNPGGREESSIWQSEGKGRHRSRLQAHRVAVCDVGPEPSWGVRPRASPNRTPPHPPMTSMSMSPQGTSEGTGHRASAVRGGRCCSVLVLEWEAAGPETTGSIPAASPYRSHLAEPLPPHPHVSPSHSSSSAAAILPAHARQHSHTPSQGSATRSETGWAQWTTEAAPLLTPSACWNPSSQSHCLKSPSTRSHSHPPLSLGAKRGP